MKFLSLNQSIKLLQYALGVTFLWFGILKLFNASPVLTIIKHALPQILSDSQLFLFVLSLIEILIGICFLANKYVKPVAILMIAHLFVATVSVLVTQGFDPRFPVLSLPGEFVVKNLVLISGGLILLSNNPNQKERDL